MPEHIEAPACVSPAYKQDRILTAVAGAPKGWRNKCEHPLQVALESGQISRDEHDAGDKLRTWLELEQRSGRDSSNVDGAQISGQRGHDYLMWPELVTDARRGLGDARLVMTSLDDGDKFWTICEKFCSGYSAREACKAAGVDARRTMEFIRLALCKLAMALALSRRSNLHRQSA